jgi:Protein of unknown function (DUF3551)
MRRRISIPALAAASIVAFWAGCSAAQARYYDYCLLGEIWGYPGSCAFSTFQQCLAASFETGFGCVVNPRYALATRPRHHRNPPKQ